MSGQGTIYSVGHFVRHVLDSLLGGDYRGQFMCARCLVKLTREHLDKSYAVTDVVEAIDAVFLAPGLGTQMRTSKCAGCARRNLPCLGVP